MNERPSLHTAVQYLEGEGRWRSTAIEAVRVLLDAAAKVGVDFHPCDADGFSHNRKTGRVPGPLNPRYDYRKSRLSSRNFASYVSFDGTGQIVSTQAIRLYHWYAGATLASEARALRVFYDHPDDARHTEYSIFGPPISDRICGRVAYNGAVYIGPGYRGAKDVIEGARLSQIVSALSRLTALVLFDVDWASRPASKSTSSGASLNATAGRRSRTVFASMSRASAARLIARSCGRAAKTSWKKRNASCGKGCRSLSRASCGPSAESSRAARALGAALLPEPRRPLS